MTAPNGNAAMMPPDPDQMVRAQAIIQSLEQMCTESRTRELHRDAAIAVLRDQLQKAQKEIGDLKKQIEAAKPKTPDAAVIDETAKKAANGKAARAPK